MGSHSSYSDDKGQAFNVATVTVTPATVALMKTKALDPVTNERLRTLVQQLVDERYEGKVTIAAKALGISHPMLLEFLSGNRGAGMKLLSGIHALTGKSLDELAYGAAPPEEASQLAPPASGLQTHRDYPPIRARPSKHFASEVVEMTDRADFGQMPEFLTWEFVKGIAEVGQQYLIEKAEREESKKSGT